jgi:hypothetical protein
MIPTTASREELECPMNNFSLHQDVVSLVEIILWRTVVHLSIKITMMRVSRRRKRRR